MYGLKRPLVIGLFIYGGGSLLGLLAHAFFRPSFSRVLFKEQAHRLYSALIMVMITRHIRPEDRGKAFGIVGSIVAAGKE
ncbi:hypothetical protein QKW52_25515 [Bacillus sonorensis]|nr:hypothetical protein [Bacillus sonorensis]